MRSATIAKNHPESSLSVIGNNLTAIRKSRGLTRAYVAYQANISPATLYRLETGKCGNVGVWALFHVCKYYGIEPHTVLIEGMYIHIDF